MQNGKLRLGFIGCGGIMHGHIKRSLDTGEVSVVAMVDPDPTRIAKMVEKFPELKDVPVFPDYKEALDKVPMDGVQIASPHTVHFEQAMAAMDHGCHCLIEKPMVCTTPDAKALIAKADEKKRVVVLSYQRHYQPQYRYIKQVVDSGQLGDVTFVAALQCQNWKRGVAGTWRHDPALSGGGQLNDSGSHLIDIILWTTSLEPKEVSAYIDNCGVPVDINSALSMRFVNGAQGTVSVVGDAPVWWEDFTIWGTKGVLFNRNGHLQQCLEGGKMEEPTQMPEGSDPDRNFINAILRGEKVWAPPICGLRTIQLTEAAWKSADACGPCQVASL